MYTQVAFLVLGGVVIGEGAYLVKLDRDVGRLTERLAAPAAAPLSGAPAPAGHVLPTAETARERLGQKVVGVPVFATTAVASAPVLDTLGSPQGRQKIQEVLATLKEERRRDKLIQSTDKRTRSTQRLKETIGAELGLDPEETRKSEEVLDRLGAQRKQLLEELQTGAKTRADAKKELDAAGRAADTSIQEIIGEKRMNAFRELRKKVDKAGDGPAAPGEAPAATKPVRAAP